MPPAPSFIPLPYLDPELRAGIEAVPGQLRVHDPRLLPFLAVAFDATSIAASGTGDLWVRISPDLGACSITPRGCVEPVIEVIPCPDRTWPDASMYADAWPLVRKGNFWVTSFVLDHPHAWDLIDGPARRDVRRLVLSVANSGIAKAVFDHDYLARCLCALMPAGGADVSAEVLRTAENARRKQDGRALYGKITYDPGRRGPIPLGYTRRGHFVFHDRGPDEVRLAHADQVMSPQYLELMAPLSFWLEQFGWRGRLNASWAGEALMKTCLEAGRWEKRRRTRNGEGRDIHTEPSLSRHRTSPHRCGLADHPATC